MYGGARMTLGPMASLGIRDIQVLVGSRKAQLADQAMYRHCGIEPTTRRIVVNKSSVHFRADFEPIASEVLICVAPGPMVADPGALPWTRLRPGMRIRPNGAEFGAVADSGTRPSTEPSILSMSAIEVGYTVEGEGPPLYMVHGIGSRRATWAGLVPSLADDFTCVSYDLRGHGDSPVPPTPYSLDDLVEDLEALRDRLGHERIHVVGHSLGGMIGPAYARAHPDRVRTVSLLSTAAGRTEEDGAKVRGVLAAMEADGIEAKLDTLVERWYTDAFIAARPDAIETRKRQVLDTPRARLPERLPHLRGDRDGTVAPRGRLSLSRAHRGARRRLQSAAQPVHRGHAAPTPSWSSSTG